MARQRTPTAKLKLLGSFKKHPERARDDEPEPSGPLPTEPPNHLPDDVKEVWTEIVSVTPLGVLGAGDRFIMEICSNLLSEYRRDPPAMNSARLTQLRISLGALGLTPADRNRLSVPQRKVNIFDEIGGALPRHLLD